MEYSALTFQSIYGYDPGTKLNNNISTVEGTKVENDLENQIDIKIIHK